MSTYQKRTSSKIYRKIYEEHHGSIPKDEFNRSYDIHHIDGDHSNNDISNLKAVSIKEHYDIHYAQCDWGACIAISFRMNRTPEELAQISRDINRKMIESRKHNFCRTGKENHNYVTTIHKFENIVTGEVVEMTQNDFLVAYKIKNQGNLSSLISRKRKTCEGWKIFGAKTSSEFVIHTFEHIATGNIVHLTQDDFVKQFDLNRGHVCQMIKRSSKVLSVKGWKLKV